MKITDIKGTRKRFKCERLCGHKPSRLSVKASRVAESMDEFTDVIVATNPANAISVTPMPGINFEIASVKAVSDPANSYQGIVPRVTAIVLE